MRKFRKGEYIKFYSAKIGGASEAGKVVSWDNYYVYLDIKEQEEPVKVSRRRVISVELPHYKMPRRRCPDCGIIKDTKDFRKISIEANGACKKCESDQGLYVGRSHRGRAKQDDFIIRDCLGHCETKFKSYNGARICTECKERIKVWRANGYD